MGFLGMLGLIALAFLVVLVYFVVTGIKSKNWKRIVFPIVGFTVVIVLGYLGLVFFITSM